jgi:hypothetical protein
MAQSVKIKSRINEIEKRRIDFAAQLGAALYPITKDNPEFSQGAFAGVYQAIAQCDMEKAECEAQLQEIEALAAAQAIASETMLCGACGAKIKGSDMFCSVCGQPIVIQQPAAPAVSNAVGNCPQCGAPYTEGSAFCMSCGAKLS